MYISPQLACQVGLNESIFLQQLHRLLLETRSNWISLTYEEWQRYFPFWSISTIRRIVRKLERLGYITSANLNKNKIDQTKSYRINYDYLHEQNIVLNEKITKTISVNQAGKSFHQSNIVLNAQLTEEKPIQQDKELCGSININNATISPIEHVSSQYEQTVKKEEIEEKKNNVFVFFEQNGFGPLSHYIVEKITDWIDNTNEALVLEALKTALEYGSTSWKYAEAVLRDWQAKNYKTVEDIKKAKPKQYCPHRLKRTPIRTEPVPEWLKEYQKQWETPSQPETAIDAAVLKERLRKYG